MSATLASSDMDKPNVLTRPPRIFLGTIIIGLLGSLLYPAQIFSIQSSLLSATGVALLVVSGLIVMMAMGKFNQVGTNIATWQPATTIVSTGLYGFSRNPIYLGMFLGYEGLMLLLNNLWLMALIVPLYLVMLFGVILREERYLEEKFGNQYLDYKRRVRRWL